MLRTIEREARFLFALLGGELWSWATAKLLLNQAWARGLRGLAAYFGDAMTPARPGSRRLTLGSCSARLWAPWVLHLGLGPESAYSGKMAKVIAFALEAAGAPIVKGGATESARCLPQIHRGQGRRNPHQCRCRFVLPRSDRRGRIVSASPTARESRPSAA